MGAEARRRAVESLLPGWLAVVKTVMLAAPVQLLVGGVDRKVAKDRCPAVKKKKLSKIIRPREAGCIF